MAGLPCNTGCIFNEVTHQKKYCGFFFSNKKTFVVVDRYVGVDANVFKRDHSLSWSFL